MASKNEAIKPTYYLYLFIVCLILYLGNEHSTNLSNSLPSDFLARGIGYGGAAVGLTWIQLFCLNFASRLFRKKNLSKKTRTTIWIILASLMILATISPEPKSLHNTRDIQSDVMNVDVIVNVIKKAVANISPKYIKIRNSLIAEKQILNDKIAKITSGQELAEAKISIDAYKVLISRERDFRQEFYDDLVKELKSMGIKDKRFLDNARIGHEEGMAKYDYLFKIQMKELMVYADLISLLENNQGRISFQSGQLIFDDNNIKQKYSNLLLKLTNLSLQEERLVNKIHEDENKFILEHKEMNFIGLISQG